MKISNVTSEELVMTTEQTYQSAWRQLRDHGDERCTLEPKTFDALFDIVVQLEIDNEWSAAELRRLRTAAMLA